MSPDERLEQALSEGLVILAGRAAPSYADDVLARSIRTRQRRAGLPFQRSAYPRRAPVAQLASATGRSLHMSSVIRFAGAASLALGAWFAIVSLGPGSGPGQPLAAPAASADASPAMSPGASPSSTSTPGQPAWVTGTITLSDSCRDPETTIEKGVGIHHRGYRCEPQTWTTSDPRLSGSAALNWDADTFPTEGGQATVNRATTEVSNDGGAWRCDSDPVFTHGPTMFGEQLNPPSSLCRGSGAYEGLAAIVVVDSSATPRTIEALIMPAVSLPAS
jgi:hypothetical protein